MLVITKEIWGFHGQHWPAVRAGFGPATLHTDSGSLALLLGKNENGAALGPLRSKKQHSWRKLPCLQFMCVKRSNHGFPGSYPAQLGKATSKAMIRLGGTVELTDSSN